MELGRLALDAGDFAGRQPLLRRGHLRLRQLSQPGRAGRGVSHGRAVAPAANIRRCLTRRWCRRSPGPRPRLLGSCKPRCCCRRPKTMSVLGDPAQAASLLTAARSVVGRGDLSISQLGARMNLLDGAGLVPGGQRGGGRSGALTRPWPSSAADRCGCFRSRWPTAAT